MFKRFTMVAGLLLMLAMPLVTYGGTVSANQTGANDAASFCQYLAQNGELGDVTIGDCINIVRGPASANANNYISGLCGLAEVQAYVGASNRGQCIQLVRQLV